MIKLLLILVLMLSNGILKSEPAQPQPDQMNLLPIPARIQIRTDGFRLTDSFSVRLLGPRPERMTRAVNRMLVRLSNRTGLAFNAFRASPPGSSQKAALLMVCKRSGKLEIHEDESYILKVCSRQIELSAETDIGILRGIETLLQLLSVDNNGYYFQGIEIQDIPRFTWRGLLIDSCRHFMPVEVIKRNLEGMSAVKLNVLHWHLTEDQGFRVECKTHPKLHLLGSDGLYYTQEQIKEVITFAADRGIRVMPEFDIPGHSTSWLVGYPELASAPGPYTIERNFGIFDPCFNPILEKTYLFFDKFFAEMAVLFPDAYIHIGGDEVTGKQWNANPEIQDFMKKNHIPDNHALQTYFNRRILEILTKHGKKMAGWEEIAQPGFPKNIVAQSWRGEKSLVEAAQKGYQVILSKGYYIDLIQPTDFHYLNDPLPEGLSLKKKQKKLILGGEATMWAELVSPETVDSRIWPRTAAIAERLWSPATIKDIDDMYRRLEIISLHLEDYGVMHKKNQAMMLRRLTRGKCFKSLKILIDVIEPLKEYQRHNSAVGYTYFSPLTRVVDAAFPDARIAREFRKKVGLFLENQTPGIDQELKKWLSLWKNNHPKLKSIIHQSPVLKEIETLSEDLSVIAEIGLKTLNLIKNQKKAPKIWIEEKKKILEKVKQPRGDTELMIVASIEKLLEKIKP